MKKKSVFGSFLSYFYGNFIVLLMGFIQTPIVTRIMSEDEYGKRGLFEMVVSIIYIFAILGMDQTYIRYYYKKDIDRPYLMKQCLAPALAIVSVIITFYVIFSGKANNYLFERQGFDIIALVVSYTIISVFERFLFLDVRMQQNGVLYSNINIIQKVLNIAFILIAWKFLGDDFRVALYAMVLSWGATTFYLAVRYILQLRKNSAAQKNTVRYPQKELIKYGLPFILVLLMEWLLSSCDKLALRHWSSFSELGIYSAAMNIMALLITFKNTFVAFWSPVAMEKYENEDSEESKAFFRNVFDLTRFLCVLAAVGLILFRQVIVLLLGSKYRGADKIIPFLTLMPIFAMMFEITVQGIKFVKKNKLLNIASACAIVFNIAGNAILVPKFAGAGAALTTGISYIVYFAMGTFLSERSWKVGYDLARTAYAAAALSIVAAIATFNGNIMITTAAGIIAIIVTCFIEIKSIRYACIYGAQIVQKLKGR